MKFLLKNAMIFYGGLCKREDLLVCHGRITEIRTRIATTKDVEVMDGTDYYILPGFIATAGVEAHKSVPQGVTTVVKDLAGNIEEDGVFANLNDELDYVYRVHLQGWSKRCLESLGRRKVKLICSDAAPLDWAPWVPQLHRLGMAVDMKNMEGEMDGQLPLSMVVSYPICKRPLRPRMVVRVEEKDASGWLRGWKGLATLNPMSYWLDIITTTCPGIKTLDELKDFLLLVAHVRSRVPAKLLGIFPRKGCIHVGADADLVFFNKEMLLGHNEPLIPAKVMRNGQFIDKANIQQTKGIYLQGNQTYAFNY